MVHALPTKLTSVSFDELLAGIELPGEAGCVVDLRRVTFITPAALVQLAALCHLLAAHGRKVTVLVGGSAIQTYLLRSCFISVVAPVATFQPRYPSFIAQSFDDVRGTNPLLIEVTRLTSGTALSDLLDQVVLVLRRRLKYLKFDAFDIATAVSEICQNTFDHSTEACGFIAMQVYGSPGNRFLEIAVADYGHGLAASLRRNSNNGPIATDGDAIQRAVQLGVSEYDDPTRGTGLYHLLEIAYKHQGTVQIRSGTAKGRFRMDRRQGWLFAVPDLRGVQVALELPTKARAS